MEPFISFTSMHHKHTFPSFVGLFDAFLNCLESGAPTVQAVKAGTEPDFVSEALEQQGKHISIFYLVLWNL